MELVEEVEATLDDDKTSPNATRRWTPMHRLLPDGRPEFRNGANHFALRARPESTYDGDDSSEPRPTYKVRR